MKRILTFLLMVVYMNAALIPQLAEQDSYDVNGLQTDDINSVIEFVRVALGVDKTADDEDDDNGQAATFIKVINHASAAQLGYTTALKNTMKDNLPFPEYQQPYVGSPVIDISTPPPDSNA